MSGLDRKSSGMYRGHTQKLTDEQVDDAIASIADGVPNATIARKLGMERTTLNRALARRQTASNPTGA